MNISISTASDVLAAILIIVSVVVVASKRDVALAQWFTLLAIAALLF